MISLSHLYDMIISPDPGVTIENYLQFNNVFYFSMICLVGIASFFL
jgi:hypothetical protein